MEVLSYYDFCFRPNRSVSDQLILIIVNYWYNQGHVVGLILFDFVKAFDCVHHQVLFHKLISTGISGDLLHWIISFLSDGNKKVSINGCVSSLEPVLMEFLKGKFLSIYLYKPNLFSTSM